MDKKLYENCGIYKITSLHDGKIYIGSSVNLHRRFGNHLWKLKDQSHRNKHLQSIYNKYGLNDLQFDVIELCDTSKLLDKEAEYIKRYDSYNNGLNLTMDTKAPMRGTKFSDEHKLKLSISRQGNGKGKTVSIPTRLKISKALLGIKRGPMTDIHKYNLRISHIGKTQSDETIAKRNMSQAIRRAEYGV